MDGLRLHIGSGCIYLTDYINVDVWGSGSALAKDCPAGVSKWGTAADDYYGKMKHIDELYLGKGTPDHETTVCDVYGSWTNLPFEDETVAEIWSVQCFEHLSKTECRYALAEARRVMKTGANLRLGVPDHAATLHEYAMMMHEAKMLAIQNEEGIIEKQRHAAFMLRHLLGSQKNDFAYHMGSWTREKLIEFCRQYGFRFVCDEPNINFYPSIHMRFEKLPLCDFPELNEPIHPWKAAWEYCQNGGPLTVPDSYKVLEVGPGTAPWPRANFFCDIVGRDLPNFILADVQDIGPVAQKFDFAFVSHCLEHVEDPVKAAAELSRVAKAGCAVCPSPFKEGMMLAHESDHKWWVLGGADRLYFKRIPEGLYGKLHDPDVSGEMHRIWRYGERRLEGLANKCKKHFHDIEHLTDVIHFWEGTLRIEILE